MTLPPLSSVLPSISATPPSAKDSPAKIKDAASQFEALMMGQILKAAHQDDGDGWGGDDSDQAASTAMDFANDYFARALASKGGFGLSNMIVDGLNRQSASHSSPATKPEQPDNTPPSDH
jgi:Rod binding domain-containing protein